MNVNPRAFFVPCSAHSLNLVVNDAAKCCVDTVNFYGLVQQISNFFSGSTRRWGILRHHITTLTVKPLSQTRWESLIDALKPLSVDISEDTSQKRTAGTTTRAEAQALASSITKFPFVVSLVTWYNILFEVNVTSKVLQDKSANLQNAITQLENTKQYLQNLRSDDGFQKMLVDAIEIANELEIEPSFEHNQVRRRRKKKQFDYEAQDESPQDPKELYKVNFYFAVLDVATESINERFNQLHHHCSLFGLLYNIQSVSDMSTEDVLKSCKSLENALQHGVNKDLDGEELCSELHAVARRLPKTSPLQPQEVLSFLVEQKLLESFPNLSVALRIMLTLPVSVASGERSFSKLKLIKTYLRSTMGQDRLVGLSTISIEAEIASALDIKHLVSQFAKQKARKVKF